MTRVPEMMAAGITVAFGHDCVMDPWYSLGSGDMLEVAHMGLHVAQMTGVDAMHACFDAVTVNAARILGLEGYGIAPGCEANLVLLDARDPVEAIRLRAARLAVVRRGKVVARSPAARATLALDGRPAEVDFKLRRECNISLQVTLAIQATPAIKNRCLRRAGHRFFPEAAPITRAKLNAS